MASIHSTPCSSHSSLHGWSTWTNSCSKWDEMDELLGGCLTFYTSWNEELVFFGAKNIGAFSNVKSPFVFLVGFFTSTSKLLNRRFLIVWVTQSTKSTRRSWIDILASWASYGRIGRIGRINIEECNSPSENGRHPTTLTWLRAFADHLVGKVVIHCSFAHRSTA